MPKNYIIKAGKKLESSKPTRAWWLGSGWLVSFKPSHVLELVM